MNNATQKGFSIVEMIVAIVVIGILATGFISAFSSVLRTSASPLQTAAMEDIAASQMDYLLSGTFQSAVAASGTAPTFTVDGTVYQAVITGQSSVVNTVTMGPGVHITVTVSTELCASCVSLSGDTFDVQ
ncbi:MAG: type II secretion system protein [Sulfuricellaceae bacterium]